MAMLMFVKGYYFSDCGNSKLFSIESVELVEIEPRTPRSEGQLCKPADHHHDPGIFHGIFGEIMPMLYLQ